MVITVKTDKIGGKVKIPPSKSVAHRALICAALSGEKIRIRCDESSADIDATASCLRSLGYKVERDGIYFNVESGEIIDSPVLDCNESGSTLRFFVPIAASLGNEATFVGAGRLGKRPMAVLVDELERHGITFDTPNGAFLPCKIGGKLEKGIFNIRGDVSSQFITGLLLALPILGGGEVNVIGQMESKPYIDITLDVLKSFGFSVIDENGKFVYNGKEKLDFGEYEVEGDYSNAAFFLVGGAIGAKENITVEGLLKNTKQGDRKINEILRRFGATVDGNENSVTVSPSKLTGTTVDISNTPDLAPILAVTAAAAVGRTVLTGCSRLRDKESDRVESTLSMIKNLGGSTYYEDECFIIDGCGKLSGGRVSSFGDHRIAMSAAIASLICDGDVTIDGAEAVNKSFPTFFELFERLGADVRKIEG